MHRNTRQLALTEDGRISLERAQRIVTEAEQAANELAERRGEISGPLRISAPRGFADTHLGPALYSFMARYPAITITAELDDRIGEAPAGYDAIIRIARADASKVPSQTLTTSRRSLVAAPSYLAQFGRPLTLEDLSQHQAIHYMERAPDDWSFKHGTEAVVARVAPRLRVTSCVARRDAAIAGVGIASLPTFHSAEALRSGALEVLDLGLDLDLTPITLAHPGAATTAKVQALVEHLKRAFGDPPYWDADLDAPLSAPRSAV